MHRLLILSVFILAIFAVHVQTNTIIDEGDLIYTHLVFRHGDRTPIKPYKNDPYSDPSDWPTGWGQLTPTGIIHQYELGQYMQLYYSDLISESYKPEEIFALTTDMNRTRISTYAFFAGMYVNDDEWDPATEPREWTNVTVHTDHSHTISVAKPCPAYDEERTQVRASDEYKEFNRRYHKVYKYLTKYTGEHIHGRHSAQRIYENLLIDELNGKPLPAWAARVYPSPLYEIAAECFRSSTYNTKLARLRSGPLLKNILEGMSAKDEGDLPELKMTVYSGHDTTIGPLLNTLGIFDPPHPPPFSACVMFELRIYDNEPYVTVVYKRGIDAQIMKIPGCGVACPLDQMKELYADVLPDDWNAECKLPADDYEYFFYDDARLMSLAYAFSLFGFFVLLSSCVAVLMCVERRTHVQVYVHA